jgi:predicted DNA binding CopG/RHH family protein
MNKTKDKDEYLEKEFNFDKAIKNPYAKELKKQMTIKVSQSVIDYFKAEALRTGIPYQTLINLYLNDCVKNHRKIDIGWKDAG